MVRSQHGNPIPTSSWWPIPKATPVASVLDVNDTSPTCIRKIFWHCPHTIRSRVYVTVRCPSVCLSQHDAAAVNPLLHGGLLLWTRWAGDRPIGRLLHDRRSAEQQRRVNAGSATFSAYVGSWTQTCFAEVSLGKINEQEILLRVLSLAMYFIL